MRELVMPALGTGLLFSVALILGKLVMNQVSLADGHMSELTATAIQEKRSAKAGAVSPSFPTRSEVYFSAITERPVFTPSRRPIQPENEAVAAQAMPEVTPVSDTPSLLQNVLLHGISGPEGNYSALLSVDGGSPDWTETGAIFGDWTLSDIGVDWIILKSGENSQRMELYQ